MSTPDTIQQESAEHIYTVPGAILVHPDGKILMVRQPHWEEGNAWSCFMSGAVELPQDVYKGTFIRPCICREVFEEVGIELLVEELDPPDGSNGIAVFLGISEHIPPIIDGVFVPTSSAPAKHMVFINFVIYLQEQHIKQGLRLDPNEILEARWFTPDDALQLPLFGNIAEQIRLAQSNGLI